MGGSLKKTWISAAPVAAALLLLAAGSLDAHDLFLRPVSFFNSPATVLVVRLINGTFDKSENAVARSRLKDLSMLTPAGRVALDTAAYVAQGDTSSFPVRTDSAGTYVIGASTSPRIIKLSGDQFNEYLGSDGLPEVLRARKKSRSLGDSASERYSKHVKTIVQVGSKRTSGFDRAFGYPAELVPLTNPYRLAASGRFRVRALVGEKPAARQLLLFGGRTRDGAVINEDSVRTNGRGIASVRLHRPGTWYVKFISMTKVANDSVNYESKWATLTFEVK